MLGDTALTTTIDRSATLSPAAPSVLSDSSQTAVPQQAWRGIAPVLVTSNEGPGVALLRHLLFPISVLCSLLISAALFNQQLTRPYAILAVLAFALSWRLLSGRDFRELTAMNQIDFFVPRLLLGWANVLAILLFVAFATKQSDAYSRSVIITWALITPIFYAMTRTLAHHSLCEWNRTRCLTRTHVIIGTAAAARDLADNLERDVSLGAFIGFFDSRDNAAANGIAESSPLWLGDMESAVDYVRRNSIDVVHITLPFPDRDRLNVLLDELRDTTASVYFLPDMPFGAPKQMRVVEMAGMPLLVHCETPYCGLQGATKRAMDLIISASLLAFLWPVMAAIAAAVKLDSPGPIIFKQRRYGLNGEEIAVYKFRTMRVMEDGACVTQARRDDGRVTRVGRFLRHTSLDELPQLFCVLNGSMSLVGPRPHAVAHNEMYRRLIDGYMLRHKVRPGITGWAQVNGLRGETSTLELMQRRVAYDLDYLRHWSPWMDIKILWRTAMVVFGDRNAY